MKIPRYVNYLKTNSSSTVEMAAIPHLLAVPSFTHLAGRS